MHTTGPDGRMVRALSEHICDPNNPDCAAHLHYANPTNRSLTGPARRITRPQRYTQHVPIRFRAETIDQAKELAERDGLTVSSWIRRLVERELAQQTPAPSPGTHASAAGTNWTWTERP